MDSGIRPDRVEAFCDWLEHQPRGVPFAQLPGFKLLFGDLSAAEMEAAGNTFSQRADALHSEIARRMEARR